MPRPVWQLAIRVQEPQKATPRGPRPGIHLACPARWRRQQLIHQPCRQGNRLIAAASVDQNKLVTLGAQRLQLSQELTDTAGFVERRDDNGQLRGQVSALQRATATAALPRRTPVTVIGNRDRPVFQLGGGEVADMHAWLLPSL